MKIAFISPYPDVTSFGIRTISAYLKENGHQTKLIFLPDKLGDTAYPPVLRYDDNALDGLIPLCADVDIIGITLMTSFYDGAVQITRKLKSRLDKPVLWGGVHPTIMPEECLRTADMICVGEGEDALLELLNRMAAGQPLWDTKNFWFKRAGEVIKNPVRPAAHSLDVYPIPDYSLQEHYLLHDGRLKPITHEIMQMSLESVPATSILTKCGYQTMTGRGCPHKCTYCINDKLKTLYQGQSFLRWRSADHVLKELVWVKENMPYVSHVFFSDDAFFAKNIAHIKDFCERYKEQIGMPFFALASPATLNEEKMAITVDAGLRCLQMGIESGSKRMQQIFNRQQMSNEKVLKAAHIINKYKEIILPPTYDFILDTPYETDEDKIETLRFISTLPRPFHFQAFSLRLYPGTELYEMAKRDGFLTEETTDSSRIRPRMRDVNYISLMYAITRRFTIPGWLLRALLSSPVILLMNNKLMKPVIKSLFGFMKVMQKTLQNLLRRPDDKKSHSAKKVEISR